MSQISPPIRILLVCAVAFMAAWMLFLRPSSEAVEEPVDPAPNIETSEPAVTGPGQAVEAAQEAAGTAPPEVAAPAAEAAAQAPAAGAAEPAPATDLEGVPKPVARAIRKEKVVALLFWNPKSPDDRAVRAELRDVDRWDGRVHVEAAPIERISRYGRITRGADVEQSPTVVVVDPELHAETLVGYVDARSIDQAVLDALRNTTGMFTSSYLRDINSVCARYADALWAMPNPASTRELAAFVTTARGTWTRFARDFRAVKAPKKWRGLQRASVRDNAAWSALLTEWAAFLGPNPSAARVATSVDRFLARDRVISKRFNRRMDDAHVLSCGSQA